MGISSKVLYRALKASSLGEKGNKYKVLMDYFDQKHTQVIAERKYWLFVPNLKRICQKLRPIECV